MTRRKALTLIVYAPALVGKDGRTLDVVHGMEKALPGLRLEWRLSEGGRPIALPQRDAWLVESIEDGGFPLVCNGDESYPVTVWGMGKSGLLSAGGQDQFEVHAKLPSTGEAERRWPGLTYNQWLGTVLQAMGVQRTEYETDGVAGYGVKYANVQWVQLSTAEAYPEVIWSVAGEVLPWLKA
jgi:hypothetical protein